MLIHLRFTTSIRIVGTHLYTWVERGTIRAKCLPDNTTHCPRSGLEPEQLDPEASALTMKPRRLPPTLFLGRHHDHITPRRHGSSSAKDKSQLWIHTMAVVSTVTKPTVRGLRQPIDVESPTVTDTDLYAPETIVVIPVEANLSLDSSIIFSRMLAIHPARRMGSTMMFLHWWSRHSGASSICEAVPPNGKIVAVTFKDISSLPTWGTIGFAKFGVAGTLSRCC